MADGNQFPNRIYKTQHIGNVRDSNNFGALRKQLFQILRMKESVFPDIQHFQRSLLALTKHLPRNNVGMVFRHANNYLISLIYKYLSIRKGHQVHGMRGSGSKHNLFPGSRIQKVLNAVSGAFISLRRIHGQAVNSPVNIGVGCLCKRFLVLDYRRRTLCRGRIVQIHKRFTVHLCTQGREVRTYERQRH